MAKKLILLGPAHPYRGGLALFNERLCQEYIAQGWEVEIYTFTLQYPSILFPGKTQYTDSPKPNNLKIARKVNSINPFNWLKIGLEIKKEKPDVVLTRFWLPFMGPCFGTILWLIGQNKHTKRISLLDNVVPHEKRLGDTIFTSYFLKFVDGFVAMSKSVEKDLRLFNKTKECLLTPHPLFDNFGPKKEKKTALSTLRLSTEYKYILFFGFVRDYKGLDLLLKAFSNPYFKENKIKLLIAGEYYNNEEYYTKLIKKLDIESEVIKYSEFIKDEEVVNFFCASDIVALPYKTATQSGVTQIAYHFEKPMLVTHVGGLAEIVPHNKVGYVVKPTPEKIADSLIAYFKDEKEIKFTKNVIQEKEKYSWSTMINKISSLAN